MALEGDPRGPDRQAVGPVGERARGFRIVVDVPAAHDDHQAAGLAALSAFEAGGEVALVAQHAAVEFERGAGGDDRMESLRPGIKRIKREQPAEAMAEQRLAIVIDPKALADFGAQFAGQKVQELVASARSTGSSQADP